MVLSGVLVFGVLCAAVGTVLQIIGMATAYWATMKYMKYDQHIGLFESCIDDRCTHATDNLRSEDIAVQALSIIGVVLAGVGLLATLFYCVRVYSGKSPVRSVRLVGGLCCIAASITILICVIVYAAKIFKDFDDVPAIRDPELSYSFGLSTGNVLMLFVAGCLIMWSPGYEAERYTGVIDRII